jgi:hypothetical protein
VRDPLGGGPDAFQKGILEPFLFALMNDEVPLNIDKSHLLTIRVRKHPSKICSPYHAQLPTRPIVLHAETEQKSSPQTDTIFIFCYAFLLARAIRDQIKAMGAGKDLQPPPVSVEITFFETAPVPGHEISIEGIQYQEFYIDCPDNLKANMVDYKQILWL